MKRTIILAIALFATLFVSCRQGLAPAEIKLDETSFAADFAGDEFTIAVLSNRDWTASADADWLVLRHDSEAALEARTYILVTVMPNSDQARSANIKIEAKSGEASANFTVTQDENGRVIRTADRFIAFLAAAAKSEAANDFRLGADIDLAGQTLPAVDNLIYTFDGEGHSIKNWTSSSSLFGAIAASGAVRNLVIDSSCKLSMPADAELFGFIAGSNAGVIENVTNNADISVSGLCKGYRGAICGENSGSVSNCVNNGRIIFSGAPHTDGSAYVGGVLGRSAGEGSKADGCINHGEISLAFNEPLSQSIYAAGVTGAANSGAKTLNCSNSAAVTVRFPGCSTNAQASGVVCYSGGEITACSNSGAVSLFSESAEGKADGAVKGTGVAGIACYAGWTDNQVFGCNNSGPITLRAGYSLGQQTVGSATKYATNVAGVVGHAYKCALVDCHNSGKVVSEMRNIDDADAVFGTTSRQSAGGIVSSSWGNITTCTNTGDVEVVWVTAAHNATLAKNFVGQIGGISGGDYHSDQQSSTIENCTNEGDVIITCDSSQSNNAFGGIVGWPGKENAAGLNEVKGCVNKGEVILDGYSKSRIGGISGGATICSKDVNYGKVQLKGGLTSCSVGGIMGFNNFFNMDACENYGDIVSDIKLAGTETSAAGGVAALVGALGNTAQTYTGCKVDCSVSVPEGSAASMILGVMGQNKAVSTKLEVGTAASPITVKGTFNGTALTASNYENYIRRPDFALANNNITFNVKYGD